MADVVVRQVRSANGASPKQRETLRSLRLGRIGRTARIADSPQARGMLKVVEHLVEVEAGRADGGRQSGDEEA
jgi:large subunit ribosomal protein L30